MMRAEAVIDTTALAHNLARVRHYAPGRRVYAAVKADGYGHGAATVARALADADGFAVSSLDEALQLRWAGVVAPIMTLSQPLDGPVLAQAVDHAIEPVVFHESQLPALEAFSGSAVDIWIKIDSGMHRLGFDPAEVSAVRERMTRAGSVGAIGWLTHLACADDRSDPMTERQMARFHDALDGVDGTRSIANSAAVLAWPEAHANMVRPGIMLYGSSPLVDQSAADCGLFPAMHLTAPVISRHRVAAGEPVGYGATWVADAPTEIAVIGIGYGDGYPRHAPSGTPVVLVGRRVPLVGRVSMDMITVDVSGAMDVAVGDRATLWGGDLPADEVAGAAGTIAYELFCRLTPRVSYRII